MVDLNRSEGEMAMHGSCLCGAVRFEAEPQERASHACHCKMCRRWTGAMFIAAAVPEAALRWQGRENIGTYPSSDWAERGWCTRCGSTLFYRVTAEGEMQGVHFLALGLFDEPDALPLASEIFIDARPAAYALAGDHPRITGAEHRAMLGIDRN